MVLGVMGYCWGVATTRRWVVGAVAYGVFAIGLVGAPVASASFAGTLDPSFGKGGVATAQLIPGTPNVADSLALQPNGKLVVGVYASADPSNGTAPSTAAIARLTPNGALDPGFGVGGRVLLSGMGGFIPSSVPYDEHPSPSVRLKLLLDSVGRILVLGSSLVRLNSDGSVDQTFGSSGTAHLPPSFSPRGMALAPSGAILVVGTRASSGTIAGAVVQLTATGEPDPSFGSDGTGTVTLAPVDDFKGRPVTSVDYRGIAVGGDGRITIAGVGRVTAEGYLPREGLLGRLTERGNLDPTFGSSGQVLVERAVAVSTFDAFDPNTLLLASGGRTLVGAAECAKYGRCYAGVVAFAENGSSTNGSTGFSGCSPPYCEQSLALAPLPGGGLLGAAWEGDLVLDFLNSELKPVSSFGSSDSGPDIFGGGALARLPVGSQTEGNVVVLPDGKVVVAGTITGTSGGGMFVAKLFGLSPQPRPLVDVPSQRVPFGAGLVSVLLRCGRYRSCRGIGELGFSLPGSSGRRRSWFALGKGSFDIDAGLTEPVIVRVTRAAAALLRQRRLTHTGLRVLLAGGKTARGAVLVARQAARGHRRSASPALRPLASGVNAFESDGDRYVLYRQGAQMRTLDTASGHEYLAGVPKLCSGSAELDGLSFPMALLSCESGAVLVNLASGRARPLPNPTGTGQPWRAIGRYWVGPSQAANCPNRYVCEVYLNWHTRAVRRIDTPPAFPEGVYPTSYAPLNAVLARDLDSPGLSPVAPCPPFKPSNLDQSLVNYRSLYEAPYVIFGTGVDPLNGDPMNSAPQTPMGLLLGRCGATAPLVLDATAADAGTGFEPPGDQVGGGAVSWYSPSSTTVSVYEIAPGRRISWAAPRAPRAFKLPAAVAHTRFAVIVAAASHESCEGEFCRTRSWTLYQAPLR
jgi:uncharacterized delta-60 repeat protein